MATKALEDIIGITPLTKALRATTSGIPNPFPAEFSTVNARNRILGDRAKWIRVYGSRATAKFARYGAPGRRVPLQPIATQPARMMYTALEFDIDANLLNKLQSFDSYTQDEGVDFLGYQFRELARRMANTRIVCLATQLRFGKVFVDSDGNVLPTSSGAADTYDSQIPANNQDQLNGIIAAPWSLNNTDIFAHLRALEKQAVKDTGLVPKHVMYGQNIPSYFQQNALLQGYFARNANFRDTIIDTAKIPQNFAEITRWTPVYTAFFEDNNGVNQDLWDGDLVVFTPEMTQDESSWYAMMEGSAAVLNGFDAYSDPMGAMKNLKQEYGQSGYSMPRMQAPLGWTVYEQDVFLHCIRNEKAIYQADVVF